MRVTLTLKTLVAIALALIGTVSTAVYGYVLLDEKASKGAIALEVAQAMQCDLRQMKNYMFYKVLPHPQDSCPPLQTVRLP